MCEAVISISISTELSMTTSEGVLVQLFGVVLGSLQGGLGEASCLAMAAFYDSRRVITFWSSGTGFAGACPLQETSFGVQSQKMSCLSRLQQRNS